MLPDRSAAHRMSDMIFQNPCLFAYVHRMSKSTSTTRSKVVHLQEHYPCNTEEQRERRCFPGPPGPFAVPCCWQIKIEIGHQELLESFHTRGNNSSTAS
jgi:hypothetical protein